MNFKLILFFIVISISGYAQSVAEGDALFSKKQFQKASKVYEALLKKKPSDAVLNYKLGTCYAELKDFESAITYLQKANSKISQRDIYLAEALYQTYRFDEALLLFQSYLATLKPENPKVEEITKTIQKVEKAAKLISKTEDIGIVDSVLVNKSDFLTYYKSCAELGSISQQQLKLSSRKFVDKIVYTTQRKDRVYYSDTIKGQMDLFTSYKLLDEWSTPTALAENLNTTANENYPFLLLDGITLYYASDGENSLGGYDLFRTRYVPSTDSFLAPENIGFPFNSPANDYMMVIDENRQLGWFATDRRQAPGKVMIYTFVPNAIKQIFRCQQADSLRNAAQLKLYRKLNNLGAESSFSDTEVTKSVDKQMAFEVNDSVVYNNILLFKSSEAKVMWDELSQLLSELSNKKATLRSLRIKFADLEDAAQKQKLTDEIIQLEKNNIQLEKQIIDKTMQLRIAENKALQLIKDKQT